MSRGSPQVLGRSPRRGGSGQATKRRESALFAAMIREATCLGARGRLPPIMEKYAKFRIYIHFIPFFVIFFHFFLRILNVF